MSLPRYPNEPLTHWFIDDFDRLLTWASEQGVSDINLAPSDTVWARLHGRWLQVGDRPVGSDEIMGLVDAMARNPSASARIKGGDDLDFGHEVKLDRNTRLRFRVNATACRDGWGIGANLVLRVNPSQPPPLDTLDLEQAIRDALFPDNGLVLITGVMGTGKSTLLASAMRHILETEQRFVITYEAPIEFDLTGLRGRRGPVVQSEVPVHVKDFGRAPRNAARRAADVIQVGESRDRTTLRAMLEAAEIGVAAYTTVHTRTAADAPARIVNVFPSDEQPGIAAVLFSALRLIVQQRLLPRPDGRGRTAIREYLVFDDEARKRLMALPFQDTTATLDKMIRDGNHGVDLLSATGAALEAGTISQADYDAIRYERLGPGLLAAGAEGCP